MTRSPTSTEEDLLPVIRRMLGEAAQLQREVAPHADRLAEAGLERLGAVRRRCPTSSSGSTTSPRCRPATRAAFEPGRAELLEAALPSIAAAVDQVAALGLPLTLHHNDLHTFNVFEVDGRMRFFDFGDAMLSEPLGTLMVPLGGIAQHLDVPADDPRVRGLAEPALEVWSDLAPLAELRAALPGRPAPGPARRCESWLRCFAGMNDAELAEWGDAAAYWLAGVADG